MEEETITVEHTPTPWDHNGLMGSNLEYGPIFHCGLGLQSNPRTHIQAANAAFIVEAANNFDSLRDRCNALEVERDKLANKLGKVLMLLLQKDYDEAREIALTTKIEFPSGSPCAG